MEDRNKVEDNVRNIVSTYPGYIPGQKKPVGRPLCGIGMENTSDRDFDLEKGSQLRE